MVLSILAHSIRKSNNSIKTDKINIRDKSNNENPIRHYIETENYNKSYKITLQDSNNY